MTLYSKHRCWVKCTLCNTRHIVLVKWLPSQPRNQKHRRATRTKLSTWFFLSLNVIIVLVWKCQRVHCESVCRAMETTCLSVWIAGRGVVCWSVEVARWLYVIEQNKWCTSGSSNFKCKQQKEMNFRWEKSYGNYLRNGRILIRQWKQISNKL